MSWTSCVTLLRPLDNCAEGGLDGRVDHTVAVRAHAGHGRAKSVPRCLRLAPQTGASRQQAQLTAQGEVRTARSGSRVAQQCCSQRVAHRTSAGNARNLFLDKVQAHRTAALLPACYVSARKVCISSSRHTVGQPHCCSQLQPCHQIEQKLELQLFRNTCSGWLSQSDQGKFLSFLEARQRKQDTKHGAKAHTFCCACLASVLSVAPGKEGERTYAAEAQKECSSSKKTRHAHSRGGDAHAQQAAGTPAVAATPGDASAPPLRGAVLVLTRIVLLLRAQVTPAELAAQARAPSAARAASRSALPFH